MGAARERATGCPGALLIDLDGTLVDSLPDLMTALNQLLAGGDSFPVRKPDAGHLLGTLGCLDVPLHSAVMLGDSRNDLQAARNAGLPVILVSFGYTRTPARARRRSRHRCFRRAPAALARLGFGK